jgi:AraC-like DNA-binding protein
MLTAAVSALFPVFRLPKPTGNYAVGTTSFHFVDAAQAEIFTADTTDRRELVVQAWYPAEPLPETAPTAYSEYARTIGPIFAEFVELPRFLFDHLSLVKTHSYRDAPIAKAEQKYLVLIFSHGYGLGTVTQNTVQMEEFAEIARHSHISVFHFSRLFKQFTSSNPYQFLIDVRLKHAALLLRNTSLPVTQICFESGFNSFEHFILSFSKHYGTSPSKYRRQKSKIP